MDVNLLTFRLLLSVHLPTAKDKQLNSVAKWKEVNFNVIKLEEIQYYNINSNNKSRIWSANQSTKTKHMFNKQASAKWWHDTNPLEILRGDSREVEPPTSADR